MEDTKELLVAVPSGKITKDFDPIKDADEKVFFHLQDKTHEFMMGLKDILQCLKFAEDENLVPTLPEEWWSAMNGIYPGLNERYSPNFKKGYYNGFWNAMDFVENEIKKGKKMENILRDKTILSLNPDELLEEMERIENDSEKEV